MAQNTLLQTLNDSTPTGTVSASHRRQTEMFLASEALVAGDCVGFDLSQSADADKMLKVVKVASGTGTKKAFAGVVLSSSVASGDRVEVVIAGICDAKVKADVTTVAVGDSLKIDSNAGKLLKYANTDLLPPVAYAVDASSTDGLCTILVIKQF